VNGQTRLFFLDDDGGGEGIRCSNQANSSSNASEEGVNNYNGMEVIGRREYWGIFY
jgi:hypothetical protein